MSEERGQGWAFYALHGEVVELMKELEKSRAEASAYRSMLEQWLREGRTPEELKTLVQDPGWPMLPPLMVNILLGKDV